MGKHHLNLGANHLYLYSNHFYLSINDLKLGTNDLKFDINDLYLGPNIWRQVQIFEYMLIWRSIYIYTPVICPDKICQPPPPPPPSSESNSMWYDFIPRENGRDLTQSLHLEKKPKKQRDNTKRHKKTLIIQWLRTDCHLGQRQPPNWLNRFTESQPSH